MGGFEDLANRFAKRKLLSSNTLRQISMHM
jgi:hypothetical protein